MVGANASSDHTSINPVNVLHHILTQAHTHTHTHIHCLNTSRKSREHWMLSSKLKAWKKREIV